MLPKADINSSCKREREDWKGLTSTHKYVKIASTTCQMTTVGVWPISLHPGVHGFPTKNIHKGACVSPKGDTTNQMDHILIEGRHFTSCMDVKV